MNEHKQETLTGFELRLGDELAALDAAQERSPVVGAVRPRRAPIALAAGFAVLAGMAAVAVAPAVLSSGSGPASGTAQSAAGLATVPVAFTVTNNGDGSVTFTARDVVDPAAATKALNEAGITGKVVNGEAQCSLEDAPRRLTIDSFKKSPSVRLTSSMYKPGGGLLVTVSRNGSSPAVVGTLAYERATDIPAC
ncbi:hypothetical protein [Micromonospora sp. B9E7]|uniref:hypothetical protein n=1 Tax=Micromonospora sp. B9E7 TaxID=3153574 RepID=UPI00325D76FF